MPSAEMLERAEVSELLNGLVTAAAGYSPDQSAIRRVKKQILDGLSAANVALMADAHLREVLTEQINLVIDRDVTIADQARLLTELQGQVARLEAENADLRDGRVSVGLPVQGVDGDTMLAIWNLTAGGQVGLEYPRRFIVQEVPDGKA